MVDILYSADIRYRTKFFEISFQFLFHRGIKATVTLDKSHLVITEREKGTELVNLSISDIEQVFIGDGNLRVIADGKMHVLDFYKPLGSSIFGIISADNKINILADHLKALGIKVENKLI